MLFSYRIFRTGNDVLLAVCDSDLLGKSFEEGEMQIEVTDFYRESLGDAGKIMELAGEATIINAVGNNIIRLLIENNAVDSSGVIEIGGVKHAQIVTIK